MAEAWAGRVARPSALTFAVAGWVLVNALATLFSLSPSVSFLGELSQREGLLTALALAGLHVASSHAHRRESHVRDTLTVVLGAGVVAAAYAQLQLAGLDPIHWQGVHTYATQGGIALRPAGSLGNPILLGAVLAAVLPIALVRLASGRGDAAWLIPAATLIAASLVMTLSRGAWLAAALAATASLVGAGLAGATLRRAAWTAALSLSPALLFGVARASGPIVARLAERVDGHSLATRRLIARAAVQLWSERPWLGVGPDAFGLAFPRVQETTFWRNEWIGSPVHAHSVPMQLLATLGIAGVFAGLAWGGAAVAGWLRAWRDFPASRLTLAAIGSSLAALCVAGATNVVGLAGATLFVVLTALPAAVEERPGAAARRDRGARALVPVVAAAAICLAELVSGARELKALSLARQARDGPDREATTPSEWRAITAVRAQSAWSAATLWPGEEALWRLACDAALAEADALGPAESGPSVAMAERAARRIMALVPARASAHERLGNALAARATLNGSRETADSADASYEGASRLAPADGWLLVSWIRFQLARRDGVRAYELSQRLIALYPEAAVGHTLSGAALLLLGKTSEAREELQRAKGTRWEEDAGEQRAAVDRLLAGIGPEPPPPVRRDATSRTHTRRRSRRR